MTDTLRVVVGEDSYLVREGLIRALEATGRVEVVGFGSDYDTLRDEIDRTHPAVLVTDIRMPPTQTDEGLRLAVELESTHPEVGVLILSQHGQVGYATELFEGGNGHRAYLLKSRVTDSAYLIEAMDSVARGTPLLDATIVGMLIDAGRTPGSGLEALTPREEEVLALVADGLSNSAIAHRLVLTTRAVERHVNSIFSKLELHESAAVNRRVLAALMYARSHG